jgi:hypothetical protein
MLSSNGASQHMSFLDPVIALGPLLPQFASNQGKDVSIGTFEVSKFDLDAVRSKFWSF